MTLQEFIESHGYTFKATEIDGTFKDFSDSLGNKGWYIGSQLSTGKITLTFGDWRRPNVHHSYLASEALTNEEINEYESTQEKFRAEKLARQEKARSLTKEMFTRWNRIGSTGNSKYLEAKGLPERLPGTIVKPTEVGGHVLVAPMRDELGEIWNFQSIFDSGDKQFFNYGRTDGLFFEFPRVTDSEGRANSTDYICEGLATGAAIHLATGERVIVAFSLSNLERIVKLFPGAAIAGDWDGNTFKKMQASGHKDPHNPGAREAVRLAKEFGRNLYLPTENLECLDNRDFADIYVEGGIEAVRAFFKTPLDLSLFPNTDQGDQEPEAPQDPHTSTKSPKIYPIIGHWVNGLEPMSMRRAKNGKIILPEEMEVAERLFLYYGDTLIKSGLDIFLWSGKHWRPFTEKDEDLVMKQIMVLHAGLGTYTRFKNVYKNFRVVIPEASRNMFYVNPHRITFNNGTLALDFISGAWVMNFREHRKDDYSTNLIPYDYDPLAKNELFEETIKNILGDDEFEHKLRAVKQMYGSVLAPMYPRLFLLVGKPGSGKSTLITLATALVSDGNVCSVQPADFNGFNMEPMAGMLVNAVTDLDVARPISDAVIKQIEDRIPMQINRKFKKAILAPFPAVHIFGANDIPPTLDRGNMAHTRRWTFIPCDHFQREVKEHDKERVQKIRESGMPGVINFALAGLKDVLSANGHFFVPESGKEKMRKWQTENDPIQSFLDAIKQGDVDDLNLESEGRCYTKILWENFVAWYQDAYNAKPKLPKMKFFSKIEMHHGTRKVYRGMRVFGGIVSKSSPVGLDAVESDGGVVQKKCTTEAGVRANAPHDAGNKLHENSRDLF